MKQHHKVLLLGGAVLAGAGILYYMYNKSTSKAAANSLSFTGKSPYSSADGTTCWLSSSCGKITYSDQDIATAQANLMKNGATKYEASQLVTNAMAHCQPITNGALCKVYLAPNTSTNCCGFCLCNPQKGISWYNPFSWHW